MVPTLEEEYHLESEDTYYVNCGHCHGNLYHTLVKGFAEEGRKLLLHNLVILAKRQG